MNKISLQLLNLKFECFVMHCESCDNDFSVFSSLGGYLDPYVYPNFCPICGKKFEWDFQKEAEEFRAKLNGKIEKIGKEEEENNARV